MEFLRGLAEDADILRCAGLRVVDFGCRVAEVRETPPDLVHTARRWAQEEESRVRILLAEAPCERAVELPWVPRSVAVECSLFVCQTVEGDLSAGEEGDPEAVETEEEKVCCRDCLRPQVALQDVGVISRCSRKFRRALRFGKNSRLGR